MKIITYFCFKYSYKLSSLYNPFIKKCIKTKFNLNPLPNDRFDFFKVEYGIY